MYSCFVYYIFLISVEKNFSPEALQIILNEPYAGSDGRFFMEIFGYGYMNLLEQLITWSLASVKQTTC